MARYAENTSVSVEKTKMEIEALVRRYKATSYGSGYNNELGTAFVVFRIDGKSIKFTLQTPRSTDIDFQKARASRRRFDLQAAIDAEERRKWRSLLLVIKAKFESAESGIETLEDAFLPQIVLATGETVSQWTKENMQEALNGGLLPTRLALGWSGDRDEQREASDVRPG